MNSINGLYSSSKKSRLAILLLLGFTASPVISSDSIISGSEQFNPTATVTGSGWANLYRPSDNSLQLLPYSIVDGMAIHEGDIVLGNANDFQNSVIPSNSNIQQGVATSSLGRRWQDGEIPYVINASYSATNRNRILAGIDHVAANTSISFIPRTSETDYVEVFSGSGCSSTIGQAGGRQTISIASGCTGLGTVAHEFFHALGVYHEQSRSDRDSFVTVNLGNVQSGREHNFNKANNSDDIGAYDYDSIMHYGRRAFSNNGLDTITPPAGVTIGNRSGLSAGDIATIQHLYYTDLQLALTTVNEVNSGQAVQATITITNQGDSTIGNIIARGVKVSLPIPSQSTYTGFTSSDSWICQQVAQNVECTIDVLDRSSNSTLNINLTAPTSSSSMQLNPTVSASNRDIQPANNSKSKTITIVNLTDMSVSMSLSKTTLEVADTLTATLNLSNPSQTDAQQVSVAITSVAAITYNSFTGSNWNCSNVSTTTTCTLASLAKSASTQLNLNYIANAEVVSANISSVVSSQNADIDPSNNSDSAAFSINTPAPPPVTTSPPSNVGGGSSGGGVFDQITLLFLLLLMPLAVSIKRNEEPMQ